MLELRYAADGDLMGGYGLLLLPTASITMIAVALLAAAAPARRDLRIQPIEALRDEGPIERS